MANEYRYLQNFFEGTLSADVTISGTTMTSAAFAALPNSFFGTFTYMPIQLMDRQNGWFETVWITAHTASSTSVTVVRGKEGTPARAWTAGTYITSAPNARDADQPLARAALPADPYVGERHTLTDEGGVVQYTFASGWQADVGVAYPTEVGPRRGGSFPANNQRPIMLRTAADSGVTNGSGNVTYTYRVPFNAQTIAVCTGIMSTSSTAIVAVESENASSFTVGVYNPSTGAKYGSGVTVALMYIASGY